MSSVSAVLAQFPNDSGTPTGPEFGKASPVGLVLILLLLVGVVLLVRSMNKKLKRLPDTFDQDRPEADQAADEGTDRGALQDLPPTDTSSRDERAAGGSGSGADQPPTRDS
ncbi:hypothetical protein [Rhodococcus sp. HNM0569]|uniref:hypothetical protein n=1 Tax=Rhodococcus sp. HNM0569 TaxID=2716340 RepID=UPI003211EEF1